jgi:hypothetical protein
LLHVIVCVRRGGRGGHIKTNCPVHADFPILNVADDDVVSHNVAMDLGLSVVLFTNLLFNSFSIREGGTEYLATNTIAMIGWSNEDGVEN